MSVFVNYNKKSNMSVEFELNNNGSVNMEKTIEKVYDIVEEQLDEVIGKYNGFSEVYDNELISKGRIFIKNTEDEEEILKRVKTKVKEMDLKLTLDKEPSMNAFYEYYYEFEVDIREVITTSQKPFKGDNMETTPYEVDKIITEVQKKSFEEVEKYWNIAFETLRKFEKEVVYNKELMEFFVYEIQRFNHILHYINLEKPNMMGYTRYWIKDGLLKHNIIQKYNLKDGVILRDKHISYFLKEYVYYEEDGNFFFSEEEVKKFIHQTDI